MRWIFGGCAVLALAACEPPIPDSGAGVGFDNDNFRRSSPSGFEQAGYEPAIPDAQAVSSETLTTLDATRPGTTGTAASSTPAFGTDTDGRQVVEASPSNPAPVQLENAGISDENDFSAVDSRRSIEDDAKRREAIAGQYQVVEPTQLPSRSAAAGPNIVQFALEHTNPPGNSIYQRFGLNTQARFDRNCRKYPSADQAQIDFLSRGGPQRDRLGIDPDGDGYACSWDPTPFRNLSGN